MKDSNYDNFVSNIIYSYFKSINLYDLLANSYCVLAGGAIRAFYDDSEIKDFDLYFPNSGLARNVISSFEKRKYKELARTNNALTFSIENKTMQIVIISGNPKACCTEEEYIVVNMHNRFDFSVCTGAYSFNKNKLMIPDQAKIDIDNRYVRINPELEFPFDSLQRLFKYKLYGYKINKEEYNILRYLAIQKYKNEKITPLCYYEDQLFNELGVLALKHNTSLMKFNYLMSQIVSLNTEHQMFESVLNKLLDSIYEILSA
jgi:hypothetical protein